MANLNIGPSYNEFVGKILNGERAPISESFDRHSTELMYDYGLKTVFNREDSEHQPNGGIIDMVSVKLLIINLTQNTCFRYELV